MPPASPRLSQEIEGLLAGLSDGHVTLREIIEVIQGRTYTLLLILICLPFCLPVPLPGLSTALGGIVALIGLRLSLRLKPWLPAAILDKPLSTTTVARLLTASRKFVRGLEFFLKPRWSFLVDWVLLHHLYGALICISGLLLLLPLPVPFSNLLPGLTVIFLAAALLERDGFFVVAGILMFAFTLVFFSGIYLGGAAAISWLRDWAGSVFIPPE